MIGEPPFDAGGVNATAAWVLPAAAMASDGAPGTVAGVTLFEGTDASPVPTALVAVTHDTLSGRIWFRDGAVVQLEAIAAVAAPPAPVRIPGRAEPPVPLTQGMQTAGVLFASGQPARDASGVLIGLGDSRAQVEQALHNLGTVLDATGLGFADVVKLHATVPDRSGLSVYREALAKRFAEPLPVSTVGQGAPAIEGLLIEIEAVAVRGSRRVVRSEQTRALEVGNLVHLAGEPGAEDPRRLVAAGDVRAQTRRAMQSLRRCLEALDGRMDDIVKTDVTLADHRLLPAFDEEYRAFFTPPYPARTTVVAGLTQDRILVEVEAVAVLGAAEAAIAVTGGG